MKKIALCTFLSLSSVFAAQQGSIKYEIEPIIGYNSFDSESKMESSFVYGIRGTAYLDNYYGYRLSYERADDVHYSESTSFSEKTTDLQRISGQILVKGEEEFNVIPYLFFGGGYEILSAETKFDVSQGYVEGGMGFKYHAYNNIQLNFEAKALKKFDTDDVDTVVQLGFGYLLDSEVSKDKRGFMPNVFNRHKKTELPTLEALEALEPAPHELEPEVRKVVNYTPQNKPVEVVASKVQKTAYTFKEEGAIPEVKEIANVESYDDTATIEAAPIVDAPMAVVDDNVYYIQMAAWFKSEDPKLLERLEKSSHPYEVVDTVRKNRDVKVVVVGPFVDLKEAKQAYRGLRKIKKDAFITKLN